MQYPCRKEIKINMATPYKCPICNGEGMIYPYYQTTSTAKIKCHGCNGTGIIWSKDY